MINKEEFLQNIIPALKIGSQIALRLEGKVKNSPKEVDFREGEDAKTLAGRTAKVPNGYMTDWNGKNSPDSSILRQNKGSFSFTF